MSRKEEYKLQNEQFLEQLRTAEGIKELPCGILYRVLEEGRDGKGYAELQESSAQIIVKY